MENLPGVEPIDPLEDAAHFVEYYDGWVGSYLELLDALHDVERTVDLIELEVRVHSIIRLVLVYVVLDEPAVAACRRKELYYLNGLRIADGLVDLVPIQEVGVVFLEPLNAVAERGQQDHQHHMIGGSHYIN